jgi:hypothetical protein
MIPPMTPQMVQLADHPFERWSSTNGWVVCIHLDGTRPCGRGEDEHAPASDDLGGIVEAGA